MDQKPLYAITWTNSVTDEDCHLRIWGDADKNDHIYYNCLFNNHTMVITNVEGRWLDYGGKNDELAAKLGQLLVSCDFLLNP